MAKNINKYTGLFDRWDMARAYVFNFNHKAIVDDYATYLWWARNYNYPAENIRENLKGYTKYLAEMEEEIARECGPIRLESQSVQESSEESCEMDEDSDESDEESDDESYEMDEDSDESDSDEESIEMVVVMC